MKAPTLTSDRLYFIPLSTKHLSRQYVEWLNDFEVNRFMETGGDYSIEKLEEFLKDVESKEILFWAIHVKSTNQHIGNIKIDPVNLKHGVGEYGIMIGAKNEWGNGYGKETSQRIIDYCFNPPLNLRKMTLGVVVQNIQAVRLYESLGFSIEGRYVKHAFHDGKYCDVLRMALFNPVFKYDGR